MQSCRKCCVIVKEIMHVETSSGWVGVVGMLGDAF